MNKLEAVLALVIGVLLVCVVLAQTYRAGQHSQRLVNGGMLTAAYDRGFEACQEQF